MRKYLQGTLIFFSFFFSFTTASSQSLKWGRYLTGSAWKNVNDITVDDKGNVYTVGIFKEKVDFDPGPGRFELTAPGTLDTAKGDIFISKLDSLGNFVWAKAIGGSETDLAKTVTHDAAGNIYISGTFRNTVDFDPGNGTASLTTQNNNGDLFLLKLNWAGDFVFVKHIANASATKVRISNDGSIILACDLVGTTADFDPGPGVQSLTSKGYSDVIICKLTAAGDFVWVKQIAGSHYDMLSTMKLDNQDNIFLAGAFSETCDFDPGPNNFNLTSSGEGDMFLVKLDPSGNLAWARKMGGSNSQNLFDLAFDDQGNVISTGFSEGTCDFDPGPSTYNLTSADQRDLAIVKLDKQGQFVWAKLITNPDAGQGDAVCIDKAGNILIVGTFDNYIDFDPGPAVKSLTSRGSFDMFIYQLTSSGNFISAKQIGGKKWDACYHMVLDKADNLYLVGSFQETVDFDLGPQTYNLTATTPRLSTTSDIFIAKYGMSNKITGITFFDINGDGIMQQGEFTLPNITVNAMRNGNIYQVSSDTSGVYVMDADTGTYVISIPKQSYYSTISPSSYTVQFGSGFNQRESGGDFGLQPVGNIKDLRIALTNVMPHRRGFATVFHVTFQNVGTVPMSGNVVVAHDSVLGFISTLPRETNYNYPKLTYGFTNLKPSETVEMDILLDVDIIAPLGRITKSFATINPISDDKTPNNNTDTLYAMVIGSFDPNDKSVAPTGSISPNFIKNGEYLDYTIRFQNTGNDTAFTVFIKDTLSNNLDPSSLQVLSASHLYTSTIEKGNVYEWRFNNILLPDSNTNEIKSHGFIRYRVRPKSTLVLGDQIKNRAAIYFDFNAPIITNQTNTIVQLAKEPVVDTSTINNALVNFKISPNPASSVVTIKAKEPFEYSLYNMSGQAIISARTQDNEAIISTKTFSKGIYILLLNNGKIKYSYRILIQ